MESISLEIVKYILATFGVGASIGAIILFIILKYFFPSYISEKGKNLATKEDIEAITDIAESVKMDYSKVLEELRSNNQLRLAEIEREKSIKREVYLQAVEAVNRTHNTVALLANLDLDEEKISSEMISDGGVIAKIQIVGSEETVKAVTKFMAAIGAANLELMLERNKLVQRKGEIAILESYRAKAEDEISRYLEIMKNINLGGTSDQQLWNVVTQNIEFEKSERENYAKKITNLWEVQNKEHLIFSKKCLKKYFEISDLLPDAVLSVRNELGLKISNEAYLEIYQDSIEFGKRVYDEFMNKLADN